MAKLRRFAVPSLSGLATGATLELSADESHHVKTLRLQAGIEIELFDMQGRTARATISAFDSHGIVRMRLISAIESTSASGLSVTIGSAWPKGKRAAILVEKCAELGVRKLIPIRFERSAVQKDDESAGLVRLRRIAAEASKQSGRNTVMEITADMSLADFLARPENARTFLLDPRAQASISDCIDKAVSEELAFIVGPEGGFTPQELLMLEAKKIPSVRLARNVLRIETAAIAIAAICENHFAFPK